MTYIDQSKPLNRLLLEDDTDDLEFHPPQTRRDGAGSWQRKRRNFAFNEGLEPDPVIERIRDSWDKGDLFHEAGESLFQTRAGVGLDDVNGQIDVAKSETLLGQAGVYDLKAVKGPTGIFSYGQQDAIRQYQTDNDLSVDGVIKPGGETMRALKAQLQPRLKKPVKAEPDVPVKPVTPPKPGGVQLAANTGDGAIMNDATPIGRSRPGGTGGSDPDRDDPPPPKKDRPDKQVAFVPVIAAAAPFVARVALPWIIKGFQAVGRPVLGATVGAAVGSRVIDGARDKTKPGKRDMLPPGDMPPNHTGGNSELPDDVKKTTVTNPGIDPVDLNKLTHIPGFTPADAENIIEIFPDMSEERRKLLPLIIKSRGDEWTQEQNTEVAARAVRWAKYLNHTLKHIGGAFDTDGKRHKEHYLKNRITGGKTGSSRLDVSLRHEKTGRILHINTIDVRADGGTPSTREQAAAERILINKENGDIVVLIPKLQKGQALNYDGLDEFLTEVIEELGKERPEIDPNDGARPDNRIHNFGKRQR